VEKLTNGIDITYTFSFCCSGAEVVHDIASSIRNLKKELWEPDVTSLHSWKPPQIPPELSSCRSAQSTGHFSDLTLHARSDGQHRGSRGLAKWRLHRSVVVRSPYFQRMRLRMHHE